MDVRSIHNTDHYRWGNKCQAWHLYHSDELNVIQELMPSGTSETLHYHTKAQQFFYILSGIATFDINADVKQLKAGESIHIQAKTLHRISNNYDSDLTFLVTSQPKAHGDRVEIINFTNDLRDDVRRLNYEWLEKYFKVEKGDEISLSNPQKEIIDKGGSIYYARIDNQIVGTVALLKKSDDTFEIGKMGVAKTMQGKGIGTVLLEHCLNVAKQKSIPRLILYSNTILSNAIHLYTKYGFTETELEKGLYDRANIKMEKFLKV